MKKKREHLDDVIKRLEWQIKVRREHPSSYDNRVTLDVRDVERLIHAAIWGDD